MKTNKIRIAVSLCGNLHCSDERVTGLHTGIKPCSPEAPESNQEPRGWHRTESPRSLRAVTTVSKVQCGKRDRTLRTRGVGRKAQTGLFTRRPHLEWLPRSGPAPEQQPHNLSGESHGLGRSHRWGAGRGRGTVTVKAELREAREASFLARPRGKGAAGRWPAP